MTFRRVGRPGIVVLIAGILLGAALSSPATAPRVSAAPSDVVCLSPGHGSTETGAVNGELLEKDLNWTIAEKLASLLKTTPAAPNGEVYSVVFTHTRGQNPDGTARAQECNRQEASTVLWIHLNSSETKTVDYFKAFWGKKNKDLAFCQELTNNFKLPPPTITDGSAPRNVASDGFLVRQSVGQFASSVMLKSVAPACLVENVFLSNTDEGNMFRNELGGVREQQIAQELYDGLVAWYAR